MKLIFLGTGPSVPLQNRKSSSILLQENNLNILIECSPQIKEQLKIEGITEIDVVLISHSHSDACGGLLELISIIDNVPTVWAEQSTWEKLEKRWKTLSDSVAKKVFKIEEEFIVGDLSIVPFRVYHDLQEEVDTVGFDINEGEVVYCVG